MGFKHLNIEKPCTQKLETMAAGTTGKFCHSCNHVVHDFSEMSTPELVEMLQSKKYTCGIFDKEQLGTLFYVEDNQAKMQNDTDGRKKYWSGIAAALVAGTLQLTSIYSQNPVRTHKLYNRNIAFEKFNTEKSIVVPKQEDSEVKKEKFDFTVLDEETKAPLAYARVVMMGISGQTDKDGRISYEFVYHPDTVVRFVAELSYYRYADEHIKLKLQSCYQKMTVLYMRKKKNNHRELVYGLY